MGTGILSILIYTSPHQFTGMHQVATVLYLANISIFVAFLILTFLRYSLYPWVFMKMLRHSTQSLFLGTIPMGLATIVNATVLIVIPRYGEWARDLAWTLWWIDVALSVISCFGVPYFMFHIHDLSLDKMTAAWLLPIVPTVVAAASGGVVSATLNPSSAVITLVVSYLLWGIGMGLSFMVMALYFHRLAIHKLPSSEVIVSAFLPLGPLGQGTFGLIQMSEVGKTAFKATSFIGEGEGANVIYIVSVIIGLGLWGLGFWWLLHGVLSVVTRYVENRLRFNMGFWGFIFPLGVFNAATIALARTLPSIVFSYMSLVFLVILIILYILVLFGTIQGFVQGTLLVAPCLSDMLVLR